MAKLEVTSGKPLNLELFAEDMQALLDGAGESSEAARRLRQNLNSLVAQYGLKPDVFKGFVQQGREMSHWRSVQMPETFKGAAELGPNGEMVLSRSRSEKARDFANAVTRSRHGDVPFEYDYDAFDGFRSAVHESVHTHGSYGAFTGTRATLAVEEATTEMLSRRMMRHAFPELPSAATDVVPRDVIAPYNELIWGVTKEVQGLTGWDWDRALSSATDAAVRWRRNHPSAQSPRQYLMGYVDGFTDMSSTQRDQLFVKFQNLDRADLLPKFINIESL